MLRSLRSEDGLLALAVESSGQIEAAARAVTDAEHELALYLATDLISTVGPGGVHRGSRGPPATGRPCARATRAATGTKRAHR